MAVLLNDESQSVWLCLIVWLRLTRRTDKDDLVWGRPPLSIWRRTVDSRRVLLVSPHYRSPLGGSRLRVCGAIKVHIWIIEVSSPPLSNGLEAHNIQRTDDARKDQKSAVQYFRAPLFLLLLVLLLLLFFFLFCSKIQTSTKCRHRLSFGYYAPIDHLTEGVMTLW